MPELNPLEVAAIAVNAASVWLAARNSVHTWWTGIVGGALFAALFYGARLYADALLQGFFIVTSVVGWRRWRRDPLGAGERPVTRAPVRMLLLCAVGGVLVTYGWAAVMRATTDAVAPLPDSAVLVFSVIAQLLLMERRLETWPVWLVVNTISVPLYASQGLVGTAALYVAFWINAAYGWRVWRRLAQTAPRHGDTPQQVPR